MKQFAKLRQRFAVSGSLDLTTHDVMVPDRTHCGPGYLIVMIDPGEVHNSRGGSRIFERGGGARLGLQAKRGGGRRGSNFGPNVKRPTSCHKRGGPDPLDPPPLDPLLNSHHTQYCHTLISH